jgi:2-methylcitrate dehydratase PrpD
VTVGAARHQGTARSRELARFIAAHDLGRIPRGCREIARRGILDALGCGLYGHSLTHVGWASPLGHDHGREAHIWGEPGPVSAAGATLANGTAIHATEMSETFIRAVVHPGNVIVPSAIAVAEQQDSSGAELLCAVALAYEILIRYGLASGGRTALLEQGLHTFSMLGAFGAAAAAAKLRFGDDVEAVDHTLGVAACLAPTTLLDGARQGAGIKDVYEGYGASIGVRAADFVSLGATGPLNSADLWLHAVIRDPRPHRLTAGLGDEWLMDSGGLRIKQLPVMGLVQPTTVAVLDILSRHELDPRQVVDIRVFSTRRAVIATETRPVSVTAAKASIPFTVAALIARPELVRDDPYLLGFFTAELLRDPAVLELAQRCSVVLDETFEHNFESADQMRYESRVVIALDNGRVVEGYADIWPSTSAMTFDEVVPKFVACGSRLLPAPALDRIVGSVRRLEESDHLGPLTAALSAAG